MTDKEIKGLQIRICNMCKQKQKCKKELCPTSEFVAKELSRFYQPIPPEGSVVIPPKLTDKISAGDLIKIAKYNDTIRKETAKEILQEIKLKCKELENKYSHICKSKKECVMETCRYEGVLAVKRELYELAKEYGVEVDE